MDKSLGDRICEILGKVGVLGVGVAVVVGLAMVIAVGCSGTGIGSVLGATEPDGTCPWDDPALVTLAEKGDPTVTWAKIRYIRNYDVDDTESFVSAKYFWAAVVPSETKGIVVCRGDRHWFVEPLAK